MPFFSGGWYKVQGVLPACPKPLDPWNITHDMPRRVFSHPLAYMCVSGAFRTLVITYSLKGPVTLMSSIQQIGTIFCGMSTRSKVPIDYTATENRGADLGLGQDGECELSFAQNVNCFGSSLLIGIGKNTFNRSMMNAWSDKLHVRCQRLYRSVPGKIPHLALHL